MAKKRVFLSFKMEDRPQVQGLRLLATNPSFDVKFYDESVRVAIKSEHAAYVRRKILEKINRTSVTVCLISTETHKSDWVQWELEKSLEKGNTIIAMALKGVDRATLPSLIRDRKLTFHPWGIDRLARLINKA